MKEREYSAVAKAITDIVHSLEVTETPFEIPPLPERLQMYFVQYCIDWMGKDGSFVAPDRALLAKADIRVRRSNRSLEDCHLYLFSDALIISRGSRQSQLFDCFIPLEHLTLWDVPPRSSKVPITPPQCAISDPLGPSDNQEFIIELLNLQTEEKMIVLCISEEEQDHLVDIMSAAISELPWPSSAIEFDEHNHVEFIWGRKHQL